MLPANQHPQNEQPFDTASYQPANYQPIHASLEPVVERLNRFQPACSPLCNSHWQQTEAVLRRHARQQAAVAHLGQRALLNIDLPKLMHEAVTTVAQVLKIQYCAIFELLPNGSTLMLQAGTGWQPGLVGTQMGTQSNWLFGYTLAQRQPVVIRDLLIETRFGCPALLYSHRIKSGINLVISGQDQPFGILGVYTTKFWTFTQDDIHFLQAVANVLAATVARKKFEARLRLMERAIAASSNGIILTDVQQPDNPVVYVNPAFEAMTGYSASEILGKNCRLLQQDDRKQPGLEVLRAALQEVRECHVVVRNYRKDGALFWNELRVAPVYDTDGYLTHFVGVQTDITDRIRAEDALKASEQKLNSILKSLEDVVWSYSLTENRLRYVNPATEKVYGRPVNDFLQDPNLWFKVIHPDDQSQVQQSLLRLYQTGSGEIEYRILHANGEVRWLCDRYHVTYDAQGAPFSLDGIATDITERKRMQEQLIHDACHDNLTGLPNRVLFMKQLAQAIAHSKKSADHLFAVLFLDLDRFKLVNDSLGHLVGDQLLVAIAHRLANCLRPNETIARLGGDEFTVLLDGMEQVQEATHLAERIHQALQLPFTLNGEKIFASASIGIALSVDGYDSPEQVLRDADIALYQAKGHSKMSHAVFNTAMYNQAVALLQLETDLRWAIEQRQLCIYYQPIVCLKTGAIVGFEALVRWHHPERGLISPAEFIPLAEEMGLILPIGHWVLQEACQQLCRWQDQFPQANALTISVNLSARQLLQPDLVEQVAQVLQTTQLNPALLKLEITESGIIQTAEPTALLSQLKALQLQLCIDDFGTGYSSLSRLQQFPIDTLKIDRSFVSQMHETSENAEIVHAIISLAHNLDMDVVAEGIEVAEQFARLKALRCEQGQGFFFSPPLHAAAVAALIAQSPKW